MGSFETNYAETIATAFERPKAVRTEGVRGLQIRTAMLGRLKGTVEARPLPLDTPIRNGPLALAGLGL